MLRPGDSIDEPAWAAGVRMLRSKGQIWKSSLDSRDVVSRVMGPSAQTWRRLQAVSGACLLVA